MDSYWDILMKMCVMDLTNNRCISIGLASYGQVQLFKLATSKIENIPWNFQKMNLQFTILLLGNLISLLIFITCPSTSWMRKSPSLFLHPNGTTKDATCPNFRKNDKFIWCYYGIRFAPCLTNLNNQRPLAGYWT